MTHLHWVFVGLYFVLIGWIAWWYGRHQKDTKDFFLVCVLGMYLYFSFWLT